MSKELFRKPGYAVLVTYGDASSTLWWGGHGYAPAIWPYYAYHEAAEMAKKLRAKGGEFGTRYAKVRVVKVAYKWPEIV